MSEPILVNELQPRPYQIYLYEKAVEENTIIYLPTGSGKTYIAVLLVKRFSGSIQKPYSLGGKRTIFIVNTVALVTQQCTFMSRHTGFKCKGYTGDMQVDFWTDDQWKEEIDTNQILVMTAQIFLNLLSHGLMQLNQVNLIIFDECHRGVKDHPMRQIMQRFEDYSKDELPRVLAMSASLLNGNVKLTKISTTLKELEITYQAKIHTVESLAHVSEYSTNPNEMVAYYGSPINFSIFDTVSDIILNAIKIVKLVDIPNKMENSESSAIFKRVSNNVKLTRILEDVRLHLAEMGLYGGSKSVLLHMIQLEGIKKSTEEQQVILDFLITQLMKIQKLLRSQLDDMLLADSIYKVLSPKVLKLVSVLKNFHKNMEKDKKFCCIIFVQRRFTAKVLYYILEELRSSDPDLEFLKPEFMVGYNNDPYKNARELICLSQWNKNVLTNFRNGITNCIIATDVVDEGVDVPACVLVIRYYPPMDFRAYIQSKGRARHSTSHFIILASDDEEYNKKYLCFKQIETYLQKELHGNTDSRLNPTDDEVNRKLYDYTIEPYVIRKEDGTVSVITEQSAVSLINQYCAKLIKSKFIMLTPTWVKKDVSPGIFKVHLTLPPVSSLRDTIVSDEMASIDDAKRSAALKACIALHKIGELDDNLLPKKVEDPLLYTEYLFPYMEKEEKSENSAIPGTNAKKRRHERVYPEPLYGAYPQANEVVYLHIIEMKPKYAMPTNDNRHLVFYNLLKSGNTYGILSTKQIPNIPSFPMFMNVGDLDVKIKVNNKINPLTQQEISSLKVFHTLIFHHILAVIKEFMLFDTENKENSFLVVPINESQQIDWDTVSRYKKISFIPPKPMEIKNSDYELALVTPTYRASNVYIVTQVCEYLKANSCFPTPDFASYVHYYKDRHQLEIKNVTQPMLEVKPISKKINCIKPRGINQALSKRKRANLNEDFEEHLVPELCTKIDFSAVLWLKATVLPSLLYRISQLLVAEDLRTKIIREAFCDEIILESINTWQSLSINDNVEQVSESSLDNTFDENLMDDEEMDNSVPLAKDAILEVDILSQENSLCSWKKSEEPPDLERCAERIQLIDIEYYHQFMSGVTPADKRNLRDQNAIKCHYLSVEKVPLVELKMLNKTNPCGPSPVDILQSLTVKMSADAFNYERVETLGDSFLKFAISLYLYQAFPMFGEGPLTFLKGKLVGNLNLYYCGKQKNIAGRMNVEDFSPMSNFVAPTYTVARVLQKLLIECEISANILYEMRIPVEERFCGRISEATHQQMLEKAISWPAGSVLQTGMEHFLGIQVVSDKTASDCVEALIGTYLSNLGVEGALKLLKWFEILPKTLNIAEFLHSAVPDPQLGSGNPNEHMPWADLIEDRIGYKFRNRAFLLQAFTHPSYTPNRITSSYQRLEFLGDAVLDFLLTVHIYESCGNLSPGEVTDLRSALVNNITFACLAVRYSLHTALLAFAPKLFEIVDRFVKFQEGRNHEINDELLWVLLEEEECNMSEHVDVPKVLGDIYESVIGAIFLDSEKNLQIVWHVIYCLMKKEIDLFSRNVPKHPIRVLHETQGANPKFSTGKCLESTSVVMITLSVTVNGKRKLFHGFGPTKKLAKCAAAKQALKYLRYKQ